MFQATFHKKNMEKPITTWLSSISYILPTFSKNLPTMKRIVLVAALAFFYSISYAQNSAVPKTNFTKMYLPVWLEAREHCLDVAKAMPEELYNYKPTEVSKTFAEQMVHIGYTVELLSQRYVEGMEVEVNTPDATKMTKAEIITLLEDGFDYVTNVINTVEQKQLDETCVMYHSGNTVSRAFAFFYVQDHLTNHRAKANLYVRMNNIQPPEYTW
jgi:uncharacterized damage-inducible protein DinB